MAVPRFSNLYCILFGIVNFCAATAALSAWPDLFMSFPSAFGRFSELAFSSASPVQGVHT